MKGTVINYLFTDSKMEILQDPDMFNFSLDTVLLANFADVKKNARVCDFGTNNGAIPMILSANGHSGDIIGVEIQGRAVKIANTNIENAMLSNITIIKSDIKDYVKKCESKFDAVYCNPPFFKYSKQSNINLSNYKTIARHEVMITLEEIISSAAKVLENKGKLIMVHRAERAAEICSLMSACSIFPKRMQTIHSSEGKNATIILIEAVFQGNQGVKILPSIIAHNEDGSYTSKINDMFRMGGITNAEEII